MLFSGAIGSLIGRGGASVISRVMGLILASVAATNVLEGIKNYFMVRFDRASSVRAVAPLDAC